jgi:tRNA-binding EMAP/Myf-like protein
MMGILSEGMILMAEDDEGKLFFLSSDAEPGLLIS